MAAVHALFQLGSWSWTH